MVTAIDEGFRLSPQQRRLWLLQQDSPVYSAQCAIRLEGGLDRALLKSALAMLGQRHEILRTSFRRLPGMEIPMQVIDPEPMLDYRERDLRLWSPQERDTEIEDTISRERREPFNCGDAPPVRYCLLTVSESESILLISVAPLCADSVTLGNLALEISCAYAAGLGHKQIGDEPVQYADLAEWQNELIQGESGLSGRDYWSNLKLASPDSFRFGSEAAGEAQRFDPALFATNLPAALVKNIQRLAEQTATSTAEVLLACWHVLLWRLNSCSNVVVGAAPLGRKYAELERALGPLSRYVPLCPPMASGQSFFQTLRLTSERWRESLEWEEYFSWPSEERSFFSACFEFLDRTYRHKSGELGFSFHSEYSCTERFKLKLCVIQTLDSLLAEFHYDRGCLSADASERLANQYHTLLGSAVDNPHAAIDRLELLGDREKLQILMELSRGDASVWAEACLHQLFEHQTAGSPHNTAVICGGDEISYEDLNARANRIGRYLQRRGVKPGDIVAISMPRSIELISGLLGILKAGAAYLPVDPALPSGRLSFILKDARVAAVICDPKMRDRFATIDVPLVCPESESDAIARESQSSPASTASPDSTAYVIYTSGSTGLPKGVTVSHRAICNRLLWGQTTYPLSIADRVLQGASIGFDFSVWEVFAPLATGASVVLPEAEGPSDISYVVRLISERQITTAHFVPSVLQLFAEEEELAGCTSLKRIFSGGEALPAGLQERLLSRLDVELYNQYGPTEAAVDATFYRCDPGSGRPSIPIGRPISNVRVYILDRHLEPVPIGVAGELHIGGVCLAQGYLGRPELTAEKFIPDPFSGNPGERLYRSGDQARFMSDGNIEFIGRLDHQVKLRGIRVELGEVETLLARHPDIREAVATIREDSPGDKRLVAYVVPSSEHSPSASGLQDYLRERLPEFMVPSTLVTLTNLPLLASGKVDRQALPSPDDARLTRRSQYVAPRNHIEERLTQLWERVLGIETVGVGDNFFDLGGHSLTAMQLISRVRGAFQLELPLRHLFERPTVESLALVVEQLLVDSLDGMSEEEAQRLLAGHDK